MSLAETITRAWEKKYAGPRRVFEPPPLKRAAAPTGPGVSPLYHLGQAEESLRKAAEAAITSSAHTRHTGQIVELLGRVEDLFERMK